MNSIFFGGNDDDARRLFLQSSDIFNLLQMSNLADIFPMILVILLVRPYLHGGLLRGGRPQRLPPQHDVIHGYCRKSKTRSRIWIFFTTRQHQSGVSHLVFTTHSEKVSWDDDGSKKEQLYSKLKAFQGRKIELSRVATDSFALKFPQIVS
jgi:hypothetical protein